MARELRQRNDSQGDKVHCSERTRSMAESRSPNESEWLHRLSMLYVCPNRSFFFFFFFFFVVCPRMRRLLAFYKHGYVGTKMKYRCSAVQVPVSIERLLA